MHSKRGKPCSRAAASAPINVSPAAVVSTTSLESAGMRSSPPSSPSVTDPDPPSVITAAPAPLASKALSAATQLASSVGKMPVSTWHSVSLGQTKSTAGHAPAGRSQAGARIKDRIEPQPVGARKRLGRCHQVAFALGDKDAAGSPGRGRRSRHRVHRPPDSAARRQRPRP